MTIFRFSFDVSADDLPGILTALLASDFEPWIEVVDSDDDDLPPEGVEVATVPFVPNWQSLPCPKCGAQSFAFCTTPSGESYGYSFHHAARDA